jgi:hypothetical protein
MHAAGVEGRVDRDAGVKMGVVGVGMNEMDRLKQYAKIMSVICLS